METSWPKIHAGEAISLRVPNIRDAAGVPVDLSTASAMVFTVRRQPREPGQEDDDAVNPVVLQLTSSSIDYDGDDNNNAMINLVAADTRDLADWYWADFWVTVGGVPFLVKASARWLIEQSEHRP